MTAADDPRRVSVPPPPPVTASAPPGADLATWNRALNREHAMAHLRAGGGRIVRAIEGRRRRLVADRVLRGPHRTAIDVGCEDGWMTEAWAPACASVVLVDVDPEPLAAAAARLAPSTRVTTVVADATDASALAGVVAPGSVDVVVLSALLEHLPRPDLALEAHRPYLRQGGRFVVFVPADGPILAAKSILRHTRTGALVRGLPLDPAPGHLQRFDRGSLAALLGRHGRVLEIAFDPAVLGYLGVVRVTGARA